jgi:hypothetical protein
VVSILAAAQIDIPYIARRISILVMAIMQEA